MRFAFVSGNPALDLVGTVGYRRDEPVDLLDAPDALEQWVLECDELPDRVSADAADLASALRLREAVHRLALDRLAGRPFAPAALDVVNTAAAGPVPAVELGDGGLRRSGDLRSALVQVARSAVTVLADRAVPLKECGRAGCTRLYLDRSRGARRTWCGMDACGNRVKAAAYRARRQAARQGPGAGEGRAAAPGPEPAG
ncbi:CGNR zinc finger domain-containing protein [Streptomyces qinglanensis]|uniref:CGNR zinc finger domain-containing protein n=1 Tax=Streptomyces qinglanensis TaxID=943816 RepID=UPI003D73A1F5